MIGNHTPCTRQPAIIRLRACLALVVTFIGLPADAQEPPTAAAGIACVSCLILHVPAVTVASLDLPPRALEGLTVVVDAADPDAPSALDHLIASGAQAGVIASGAVPSVLLSRAAVVIARSSLDDDSSVFGLRTLATAARGARPDVRVLVDGPELPDRVEPYVDGRVERGSALERPTAADLVEVSRRGSADVMVVTIRNPDWQAIAAFAGERALATEVTAAQTLTAEQVVARHQVQRRRQEQLVRTTIARGTTTLLFEVPGFVAPVTVTAETVIYRQPGLTELEQRNVRVNGAAVAGGDAASPPKLPLIEPERVATPPLVIALDDAYRYSIVRRERGEMSDAYVVRFDAVAEPTGGLAWIDATTFALRRLETVQSGLAGAIVSSEQHDVFAPFAVGSETVWLPVQTHVYQMYEGAGHRTPIHRSIETPGYSINPEDFEARLRAAYASPNLMLRETPQGFRYLLRDPRATDAAVRAVAPRAGERIRTAVAGVLVDPNITTPLPFAGFSYVDLNLFDTGSQLNVFFGGSYGQLSWSTPSIGGTRWRAHGRAFAIAARYNDRAFRGGAEQYRENIRQRPAHLSAGVVRPLVWRLRGRFEYALDYTAFERGDTTGASFVVPHDAIVHGFVAAVERESGPLTLRAWWNPARRQHWRAWGNSPDERAADHERTFQRYGASLTRTLAVHSRVTSRVELAWMDGRDLDRFSRYSFGAFENPLRGYPTASIRYDRGTVLRTVTTWSGRGFRIDAFGDIAGVRDPAFGPGVRTYPGAGAALETAGPFRTLWSIEWGYGFRGQKSDGGTGTQGLRVTMYRTF
jgi:hypothetical protein